MTVIVISGMPGAGSSTVGKLLSKKLKLKYFSIGQYFKEHAKSAQKETEKALQVLETKKGTSADFHHSIDKFAVSLAEKGEIVIDAKIGIRMLKGKADLNVWLKALPETRAKRYVKRDKTSISQAMKQMQDKEAIERKIWKKMYGFDYFSQEKEADIVIDTSDKSPEEIVDIILRNLEGGYRE